MRSLLIAALALPALSLAACGGDDPSSLDAAKKVAQEEADRYSSEDYGGAWDLWSSEAKDAISREDYAAFFSECPGPGVPYEIDDIREDGDNKAVVRLAVSGTELTFSYGLVFEGGEWRWQPNTDDIEGYRAGLDAMVEKAKSEGRC